MQLWLGEERAGVPTSEEEGELSPVEGVEREDVGLPEEGEADIVGEERLPPRSDVAASELHRKRGLLTPSVADARV